MVNNTPWMTRREAATYARVSEQTIDAWRKAGLPSSKRGRRVLIDRRDLDRFLRAQDEGESVYRAWLLHELGVCEDTDPAHTMTNAELEQHMREAGLLPPVSLVA